MGGQEEAEVEAEEQQDSSGPDAYRPVGCQSRIASCDPDACHHSARLLSNYQEWLDRTDSAVVSGPSKMTVLLEVGDRETVVC